MIRYNCESLSDKPRQSHLSAVEIRRSEESDEMDDMPTIDDLHALLAGSNYCGYCGRSLVDYIEQVHNRKC